MQAPIDAGITENEFRERSWPNFAFEKFRIPRVFFDRQDLFLRLQLCHHKEPRSTLRDKMKRIDNKGVNAITELV